VSAARPLPLQGETPPGLPPSLPLAHFAAVPVWFGLGAAALVAVAPDLAGGNLFAPRVFAATHLFTLGVVATAIFGALYQFVPAVLGVPIRSAPVARAGTWLLALGVAALVAGFWRWTPALQGAGWLLLFGAVGCSSWNVLPARRRASRNRIVGLYLSLSHSWLGVAMALGAARIGSALGWWRTDRAGFVAAHFHLGTLGFATLTVVGIGSLMIPGFLGSKGHSERPLRWIGWVSSAGLALFSAGELFGSHAILGAGAAAMLAGVAAHLGTAAGYYRRRGARRAEPGLGFIAMAFVFQAAAAAAGVLLYFQGGGPSRGWAAYAILALLGWLVLLVLGVMHRVVPRLLAQRIAARHAVRTTREARAELLHEPLAWTALALLGPGVAALAGAVALGNPRAATAASMLYAAGAALVLMQGVRLAAMALRPGAGLPE
jgi:hypothetical protein